MNVPADLGEADRARCSVGNAWVGCATRRGPARRAANCATGSSPQGTASCVRTVDLGDLPVSDEVRPRRRRGLARAVRVHAQPHAARAGEERRRARSRSSSTRPIRERSARRPTSRGSRSATARVARKLLSTIHGDDRAGAGALGPRARRDRLRHVRPSARPGPARPARAGSRRPRVPAEREAPRAARRARHAREHSSAAGRVVHPANASRACRPIGSSRSTATT